MSRQGGSFERYALDCLMHTYVHHLHTYRCGHHVLHSHLLPTCRAADDCWMEKRDASGRIVPFSNKFPSGMKALADYIHDL